MEILVAVLIYINHRSTRQAHPMPNHRNTTVMQLVVLAIRTNAGLSHNGRYFEATGVEGLDRKIKVYEAGADRVSMGLQIETGRSF